MHWIARSGAYSISNTAQQHGDLGTLTTVVNMRFVNNYEAPLRVAARIEQIHVMRTVAVAVGIPRIA